MNWLRVLKKGMTFEDLLVVVGTLIGFAWGLTAISDNTALVHIRTGIDMFRTNHVLHRDPYSYTAHGEPWVLQSWLAEYLYGVLHALWSSKLIAIVNAVVLAGLAGGLVQMVRTGKSWLTFVGAASVFLMSVAHWSTRPTTFAFFLFFLLFVVAKRSLWWTVLIGVLWVNMHGSWPVAVLWLMGVAVGTAIDERRVTKRQFERVGAFIVAVVAGGIFNPVGWRLLTFPLTAFEKGDVFEQISEWRSPNFHSISDIAGYGPLVGIVLSVMLLVKLRPSWKHLLPFSGLLAMSLYSSRNLPMLAIGLASILVVSWRENYEGDVDAVSMAAERKWGPVEIFCIVVMGFVALFQVVRLVVGPDYALTQYPVAGISYAKQLGYFVEDKRVFAPDYVGCFLILEDGKNAGVFIDDRYDMYPEQVSRHMMDIVGIDENTKGLLDQYDIEAVLWPKNGAIVNYLASQDDWSVQWSDKKWVLLTHRDLE